MISIIITYYTGLNILCSNLSLLLQTNLSDVEIIIVNDNPKASLTLEMLPTLDTVPMRILTMPSNGGYAAACNYGVENANGELLIFMDSDILVGPNWLAPLLNAYYATDNCGAVSTTILNLNQKQVVHWGLGMNEGYEVVKPFRDGYLPKSLQHGTYEFSMASSGCILIPKDVFQEVGRFDEQFYNGFCDLDLTYRITQNSYKCVYCSEAVVYHRGKVSGTTRLAAEDDTRALFIKKWKNALPNDGMQILPHLYKANINFNPMNSYVLVNFSRSLLAKEYHLLLLSCLKASMTDYYEFKNQASPYITLEDFLTWGLCGLNIAIIYFSDNITTITNNQHWFAHRVGKGDIIVDRNGNLFLTDNLII